MENIHTLLCTYDKRNPDNPLDEEEMSDLAVETEAGRICHCDNCFYGRTKLAQEIIKMREEIGIIIAKYDISIGGVSQTLSQKDVQKIKNLIDAER